MTSSEHELPLCNPGISSSNPLLQQLMAMQMAPYIQIQNLHIVRLEHIIYLCIHASGRMAASFDLLMQSLDLSNNKMSSRLLGLVVLPSGCLSRNSSLLLPAAILLGPCLGRFASCYQSAPSLACPIGTRLVIIGCHVVSSGKTAYLFHRKCLQQLVSLGKLQRSNPIASCPPPPLLHPQTHTPTPQYLS